RRRRALCASRRFCAPPRVSRVTRPLGPGGRAERPQAKRSRAAGADRLACRRLVPRARTADRLPGVGRRQAGARPLRAVLAPCLSGARGYAGLEIPVPLPWWRLRRVGQGREWATAASARLD